MNQVELGIRKAKVIIKKYKLECTRHLIFEYEKEIQEIHSKPSYTSVLKQSYRDKIDILDRVEMDLEKIIKGDTSQFDPDYYKLSGD